MNLNLSVLMSLGFWALRSPPGAGQAERPGSLPVADPLALATGISRPHSLAWTQPPQVLHHGGRETFLPASGPRATIDQRVNNLCSQNTHGHMQAHTQYMPAHAQNPAARLIRGLSLAKRQTRFLFVFGMNEWGSFLVLCFNTPELGLAAGL